MSASDVDWRALLVLWSGEIIGRPDLARHLSPDVRARGWLGFPAASEEQIRAAEARLGTYLPPSYRQFLKVSNGWRVTGTFAGRVYSCEEIRWFRVEHQDWIDAYVTPPAPAPHRMWSLSDAEYFVYGDDQDPARIRPEYLQTALEISAVGDSALYLLNPTVVSDDGEWEAWHFANWLPGANRFRSFWEMMIAEHASFVAAR